MNACSKWEEALLDAALGGSVGSELREHLAVCSNCSTALAQWRQKAAQFEATIGELVSVEPRPQGPERVLARIGAQPVVSSPWRVALASVLVVAGLVLAFFVPRPPGHNTGAGAITISEWRSPTQGLLASFADPVWKGSPSLGQGIFNEKPTGDKNVR